MTDALFDKDEFFNKLKELTDSLPDQEGLQKRLFETLKNMETEPIFVLRAQDATAATVVGYWIDMNKRRLGRSHPKILSAEKIMHDMLSYKNTKQPD